MSSEPTPIHAPSCAGFDARNGPCAVTGWPERTSPDPSDAAVTLTEGFAGHGSHRPGSVCFECDRLASDAAVTEPPICADCTNGYHGRCTSFDCGCVEWATGDCAYECPFTEEGHAAMDVDHQFVATVPRLPSTPVRPDLTRLLAIEAAAQDVDAAWSDDKPTLRWSVEAGEALADLRAALRAEQVERPDPEA